MEALTVCLMTAVYDGYDALRAIPFQSMDHEAICVTDDPHLHSDTWKVVQEPRPGIHPNRAAKRPKMDPWRYTDAEVVVWVDASYIIRSNMFLEEVIDFRPLGQFEHPSRSCIYTEADSCMFTKKYEAEPIAEQLDYYRRIGHPANWGLWAGSCIVWQHSHRLEQFGKAWLTECEHWSFQDQISEAPLLREFDLWPNTLPGRYDHNQWLTMSPSERH